MLGQETGIAMHDDAQQPSPRARDHDPFQTGSEAERALRATEQRFRAVADYTYDWETWLGSDGRPIWINPAVERFTGYSAADCLAMPDYPLPLIVAEDRGRIAAWLQGVLEGSSGNNVEFRVQRKDGAVRWMGVSWQPIVDDNRQPLGYRTSVRDINGLKKTEQALKESEERFRQFANNTQYALWIASRTGEHVHYVNKAYEAIWGRSTRDLLANSADWFDAVHPEDRDAVQQALLDSARHEVRAAEFRIVRVDGSIRWVRARRFPLRDDEQIVCHVACIAEDFTEQHLLAERLNLARLAGRVGIFDWCMLDNKVIWTVELEQLFDLAPGTFPGTFDAWIRRIHPDDVSEVESRIAECLRTKNAEIEFEHRVVLPDGQVRYLSCRGICYFKSAGCPSRMIGMCIDITARKRVELALQEADRRKDDFLAMIGHELRNPLAAIAGGIDVLNHIGAPDQDVIKIRGLISRQSAVMTQLIEDLLDLARISHGKITLRKQQLDLVALVRTVCADFRRPAITQIVVELPAQLVWVTGDITRLSQIAANLIQNACKFCQDGTITVVVEQHVERNEAVLSVRDTGIGMDRATLASIFEPFTQAEAGLKHTAGGLGLGLSVVRGLVTLHGGTVDVHSEGLGKGAEFRVVLPLLSEGGIPQPAQ